MIGDVETRVRWLERDAGYLVRRAGKLQDLIALTNQELQIYHNQNPIAGIPPINPGTAAGTVNVYGCIAGAWPGATVTLTQGGSTVASGTTNSMGQFSYSSLTAASTVFAVNPNSTLFATPSNQTVTLVGGVNPAVNFTLTPATGYACASGQHCVSPLPTTLYLTLLGVTYTLTYSPGLGYWTTGCVVLSGVTVLGPTTKPVASCCGAVSTGSTAMEIIYAGGGYGPQITVPGCDANCSGGSPNIVGALAAGCPNSFTNPLQALPGSITQVCSPFSQSGNFTWQFGSFGGVTNYPPFPSGTTYTMSP